MNWSKPHITKVYEALGAIGDGRLEMKQDNSARMYSSSRNKFYVVLYNPLDDSIMTNDNASYYVGYLGYPMIAYLMKIGKIPFDEELSKLLSGIAWKDINQQFKNDFDKTREYILDGLVEKGYDRADIERRIRNIYDVIVSWEWKMNGKKIKPPEGY